MFDEFDVIKDGVVKAFFAPPQPPSTLARALEGSHTGLKRLQLFSMSARAWVERHFEHDFVKAVMLNWALAPQILPEQEGAGQSFYVMIPAIHVFGQAVPEGGSQQLPNAMARFIEARGGRVLTGKTVSQILVENGRAAGLKLEDGTTLRARRAVVSALDPKQTFLRLTPQDALEPSFVEQVKGYSFGRVSICRAHLALKGAAGVHQWRRHEPMCIPSDRRFRRTDDWLLCRVGAGRAAKGPISLVGMLVAA